MSEPRDIKYDEIVELLSTFTNTSKQTQEAALKHAEISIEMQRRDHKSLEKAFTKVAESIDSMTLELRELAFESRNTKEKLQEAEKNLDRRLDKVETKIVWLDSEIQDQRLERAGMIASTKTENRKREEFFKYWVPILKTFFWVTFIAGTLFVATKTPTITQKAPTVVAKEKNK